VPFPHSANHICPDFIILAERKENERTGLVLTRNLQMDKREESLKIGLYDHKLLQLSISPLYPEGMNTTETRVLRAQLKQFYRRPLNRRICFPSAKIDN
jgi:hypothetical protein